tara:strand:- start:572 stop:952 length:381 start_codon:yes stop_codon:yes gene_type:complete
MANSLKSVELHKLEGTYRKDRHDQYVSEDPAKGGFPPCPEHLTGAAAIKWLELEAQDIGVIRAIDAGSLEVYCTLWGEFIADPTGIPTSRIQTMNGLAARLYLDPASRAKMPAQEAAKPKNPWSEF